MTQDPTQKVEVKRVAPPQPPPLSPNPAGANHGAAPQPPIGVLWPTILQPPSRNRAIAAFIVAILSDALSFGTEFLPPVQIVVDLATALTLWGLLGWRWVLLPALVAEAIPAVALFPTWTLVAGAYLIYSKPRL